MGGAEHINVVGVWLVMDHHVRAIHRTAECHAGLTGSGCCNLVGCVDVHKLGAYPYSAQGVDCLVCFQSHVPGCCCCDLPGRTGVLMN